MSLSGEGLKGLKITLKTLLGGNFADAEFDVRIDQNNRMVIKAKALQAEKILKRLQDVFSSHGCLEVEFPFYLQPRAASQQASSAASLSLQPSHASQPQPSPSHSEPAIEQRFPVLVSPLVKLGLTGNEVFARLFSEPTLRNFGTIIEWAKREDKKKTVFFYPCKSTRDAELRTSQISFFKTILAQASWQDLYNAFREHQPITLPVPKDNILFSDNDKQGQGPLSDCLDQIFKIHSKGGEKGQKFVLFDAEGLLKYIVSPNFELMPGNGSGNGNEDQVEIAADWDHILAYLSRISSRGLIFRAEGGRLYPGAVSPNYAIQADTIIDFLIDCSGSMQEVFGKLKTCLKATIEQLSKKDIDPNATTIRLCCFGAGKDYPVLEFPLAKFGEISRQIDNLQDPANGTPLYEALTKLCKRYQSVRNRIVNYVCVLISDGEENVSWNVEFQHEEHAFAKKTQRLTDALDILKKVSQPPKFFSIEIGTKIDERVLSNLQAILDGERINVNNNLSNFEKFYQYLEALSKCRSLYLFIQEGVPAFRLKSLQGEISFSDQALDRSKAFEVNGAEYQAVGVPSLERKDRKDNVETGSINGVNGVNPGDGVSGVNGVGVNGVNGVNGAQPSQPQDTKDDKDRRIEELTARLASAQIELEKQRQLGVQLGQLAQKQAGHVEQIEQAMARLETRGALGAEPSKNAPRQHDEAQHQPSRPEPEQARGPLEQARAQPQLAQGQPGGARRNADCSEQDSREQDNATTRWCSVC